MWIAGTVVVTVAFMCTRRMSLFVGCYAYSTGWAWSSAANNADITVIKKMPVMDIYPLREVPQAQVQIRFFWNRWRPRWTIDGHSHDNETRKAWQSSFGDGQSETYLRLKGMLRPTIYGSRPITSVIITKKEQSGSFAPKKILMVWHAEYASSMIQKRIWC